MEYSKIQKSLSSLLIFLLLGGITFRLPFFGASVYASTKDFFNIVSIIVDEETYNEVDSEIERYAKDIQGALENTRVIILPTPKNTSAFKIASLNESLYFEGYKSIKDNILFNSKLIGTVLIGNIDLPIVYNLDENSKTIVPFTDFEDKSYIYNHETKRYEKNSDNIGGLKSEIWHGIISPNFGDKEKNIEGLKNYFDKNHDFYQGTGNFKAGDILLNGKESDIISDNYKPFVFYYDQFREEQSLNYSKYLGYKAYLENREDLVYNRYTKGLAKKINDLVLGESTSTIEKLAQNIADKNIDLGEKSIFPKFDGYFSSNFKTNGPELKDASDISTRYITQSLTKKFLEIFSKGVFGNFRSNVHNAGRYNFGQQVNADFIPYFISILDEVNDGIIKEVNNETEKYIDDIVINKLAKDITIPLERGKKDGNGCITEAKNYFHGKKAEDLKTASDCSIYRGSIYNGGQVVEANRGLNVLLAEYDGKGVFYDNGNILNDVCSYGTIGKNPTGVYSGSSPLNLSMMLKDGESNEEYKRRTSNNVSFKLEEYNLDNAILPLFDIAGSINVNDGTKANSPKDCLKKNFLKTKKEKWLKVNDDYECVTEYQILSNSVLYPGTNSWNCSSENIKYNVGSITGSNTFPSYIKHKSPTARELYIESKTLTTPNLPIDKNRYIDYFAENVNVLSGTGKDSYKKIEYPYLFRLKMKFKDGKFNIDEAREQLDSFLDEWDSKQEYDFSIKDYLKDKSEKLIKIGTEEKSINYYDTLAFAIYWNNLNSVSAKYAVVFDSYLDDQFGNENKNFLIKNKKEYEIAFLGAIGDAQNMYVKVDPEAKSENPYSNIISANINLNSNLFSSNIGTTEEGLFECAPPDGVPIWEWIPAVICWLKKMLPPKISFGTGNCGPALLSNEDESELEIPESCAYDDNKNGIKDCIEETLKEGSIELSTDSSKYYYNKYVDLKARIKDKEGKYIKFDNSSNIKFELLKIEDIDGNIIDEKDYKKYVGFNYFNIGVSKGMATYGFTTKSLEANLYFKASIELQVSDNTNNGFKESVDKNGNKTYVVEDKESINETIVLKSNDLKVKIRGDRLFSSFYKISNNNSDLELTRSRGVLANNKTNIFISSDSNIDNIKKLVNNSSVSKEKLVIILENLSKSGDKIDISYPLNLKLLKGDEEIENKILNSGDMDNFKGLFSLKESGSYKLEIIDPDGYKVVDNIEILAEKPEKIDIGLGTTIMETSGNISTNFVTLYDKYENITSGNNYKLKFSIDGGGIVFLDNNEPEITISTFEGYKIFRLKSTNISNTNVLKIDVLDFDNNKILSDNIDIKTSNDINLVAIPLSNDIKVGGGIYEFEVSLRDRNGALLHDFNSRVYLTANKNYLIPLESFVDLKDGKAIVKFKTKKLAGKDINIEFQVEGLNKIVTKKLTILPEKPVKMDLILSSSKIEASETASSNLLVELKDRYNNLVFNESSINTNIEILDKYKEIITVENDSRKIINGKTSYKIFATSNPGTAYFKVSTNPSLNLNSFIIKDKNGELEIKGVGENVGKIETFYFWNDKKLEDKKYNALYTVLLGANYGDIYKKNYLAGSLLFNKNNRALAVSSVLNNPFEYNNILELKKTGAFYKTYNSSDLSQDIEITTYFKDNKLGLSLFNKSLNTFIGNIFYNFSNNSEINICETNIGECFDKDSTSIVLKSVSSDYNVYEDDNKLILIDDDGNKLFSIGKDGEITKFGKIGLVFNEKNIGNYLLIDIYSDSEIIGKLGFKFENGRINISREEGLFNSKINTLKNSILVYMDTNSYGTYDSSSLENSSKIFYYNDPFASKGTLNSFSKSNLNGFENFENEGSIGWKEGNKSLLAFSSGKSVGESVQDYMSFSVINLGDPVLKLRKINKNLPKSDLNRKFDSTIGKLISKDENIDGYSVFDYDNDSDNKDDILLIKDDSYLKLIENVDVNERFLDKGNLAYIVDLGSKELIQTGDFTGDGFEDIFFISKEGKPYLLNNFNKDFSRYSLIEDFSIDGKIIRDQVFDMDNDGIDDIVTLDNNGEINIFYGGGTDQKPKFIKNTVDKGYGINIDSNVRTDNSLIYFDGLYQPDENLANQNDLDRLLYIKYPYSTENIDFDYSDILNGSDLLSGEIPSKYFVKSDYVQASGLEIKKVFKDRNEGVIKTGDIVDAEIVLKNISGKTINNIVFAEKIPEMFSLDFKTISLGDKNFDGLNENLKSGLLGTAFLIDGIKLNNGEEIKIKYESKLKDIKYFYIRAGLFEKGEIGDDEYGDIIVQKNNKNCGDNVTIFRSETKNTYIKGIKIPDCNEANIKLPPEFEKNAIDENNNGIPDYIDVTIENGVSSYDLDDLIKDSDGDGLVDEEDFLDGNFLDGLFDGTGADVVLDFSMGDKLKNFEDKLDNIQKILEGLRCGNDADSCFVMPLNWAPFAPGNSITINGKVIPGDLIVEEGIPIFSSLTGLQTHCGTHNCCLPSTYPANVQSFVPGSFCGTPSAGGSLGTTSPVNSLRVFVTPTLTAGVGTAICFGGVASVTGNSIPMGLSPLLPGGNCVVLAKNFNFCEDEDYPGDPGSIQIPGGDGIVNANCDNLSQNITKYDNIYSNMSYEAKVKLEGYFDRIDGDYDSLSNDLIQNGLVSDSKNGGYFDNADGNNVSVELDLEALGNGNFEDIIKIEQPRVSAFPDWMMDWATRQIEEIANKLTDFPTVFIILPDFTGVFDGGVLDKEGNGSKDSGSVKKENKIGNNNSISLDSLNNGVDRVNSGIKEAYEFLGNIPLVNIEQETINVEIPWLSGDEIAKIEGQLKVAGNQMSQEIESKVASWASTDIGDKLILDARELESSIRENYEIILEYAQIPEKINELISKKQEYLEQILCNIEAISSVLGGWIGKNGERFKAWVEVFILIKAILKSWQLLVDVFVDYEAECHECKNERQDLLDGEFKLIEMIIPKIPIIKFPKWPDVIMDLHNIRAGLTITMPEFAITTKPILIPSIPELILPDVPNINFKIPKLPLLPRLEIPELPDLPSLPTIELPDLPPPPKLPKMFGALEMIVDILKLITKAMCILKSLPIHPEWRAGDQIAFLTERNGYLPIDFIKISSPQFSFPFIDAIEVTTYVNLEFETDFIVEMARQIVAPLNDFSNDFTNMFNIDLGSLDFSNTIPSEIDLNEVLDIDDEIGMNNNLNEEVSAFEFKKILNKNLASKSISSNPKMDKIREVWKEVDKYTYSKENKLIKNLQKSSIDKFNVLSDIINTEIIRNKKLKKEIKNIGKVPPIIKVGSKDNIKFYNENLNIYNKKFKDSALKLMNNNGEDNINKDIRESGENLLISAKTVLSKYKTNIAKSNLLTAVGQGEESNNTEKTSCQIQASSDTYKYNYKGLYVIEEGESYRLFDYLGEIDGEEKTIGTDIDNDGDLDILYLMSNQLFLKENLKKKYTKKYVSENPIVLDSGDNKFFNGKVFYESINNLREVGNDDGYINLDFSASTDKSISNYRVGFYDRIDKDLNKSNPNYKPRFIKREIIDSISNIEEVTKIGDDTDLVIKRKNIVYIKNTGNLKGVKLITPKLINIREQIESNKIVNILKGTSLYAGKNNFEIKYKLNDDEKEYSLSINSNENIEFKKDISIYGITGNAYIKVRGKDILEGINIREYLEKPLFTESKIIYYGEDLNILDATYIELEYYDNSELALDFSEIKLWELYDLGRISNSYSIRLKRNNDFYYLRANTFKNNIQGTLSNQILIAPQREADIFPPELDLDYIRIPVYQSRIIDLEEYIYENSGIGNIKNVEIDLDLNIDSDGDGDTKNDDDPNLDGEYKDKIKVLYSNVSLKLKFEKFDEIFMKKIGITLTDSNNNVGYHEVYFEVYPPLPEIRNYKNGKISGDINEILTDEPIDLYRFRGGMISKLEGKDGLKKAKTADGKYNFDIKIEGTGLKLYENGISLSSIKEESGKIVNTDPSLITEVLSGNNIKNNSFNTKILVSKAGKNIFYESFNLKGIKSIKKVDDFSDIKDKGVYFKFTDKEHYNYYILPQGLDYNPGALSIYRNTSKEKIPLFSLFTNGRIYNINPNEFKIEYSTYNNYILLKLIDSKFSSREIGKVLFVIDGDYILK